MLSLVDRINKKFSSGSYKPIVWVERPVSLYEKIALYSIADVAVVTATRDGMNLVPYEYVVCRQGAPVCLAFCTFCLAIACDLHMPCFVLSRSSGGLACCNFCLIVAKKVHSSYAVDSLSLLDHGVHQALLLPRAWAELSCRHCSTDDMMGTFVVCVHSFVITWGCYLHSCIAVCQSQIREIVCQIVTFLCLRCVPPFMIRHLSCYLAHVHSQDTLVPSFATESCCVPVSVGSFHAPVCKTSQQGANTIHAGQRQSVWTDP